jgi:hypothetical protein
MKESNFQGVHFMRFTFMWAKSALIFKHPESRHRTVHCEFKWGLSAYPHLYCRSIRAFHLVYMGLLYLVIILLFLKLRHQVEYLTLHHFHSWDRFFSLSLFGPINNRTEGRGGKCSSIVKWERSRKREASRVLYTHWLATLRPSSMELLTWWKTSLIFTNPVGKAALSFLFY